MLYDDLRTLVDKYAEITSCLNSLDQANGMCSEPSIEMSQFGRKFYLYGHRKCQRDAWQTLVDLDLNASSKFTITDLVLFNLVDLALWQQGDGKDSNGQPTTAFSIDDKAFYGAISPMMFAACCMMLQQSKRSLNMFTPYIHSGDGSIRRKGMECIAKIDKMQPLFLAKLFTSDIKWFMACIEYSNSVELPSFVVKSFIKKTQLNPPMFRTVVSLFKQEMAALNQMNMFKN